MAAQQPGLRRRRSASAGGASECLGELEKLWDDGQWHKRESLLRKGLTAPAGDDTRATVFTAVRSANIVWVGMIIALTTILGTIASSCYFGGPWRELGLIYPYISETARDMPQTGGFGFGMTVTCMVMVACAVLQFGKVKRDLDATSVAEARDVATNTWPKGSRLNLTGLIAGLIAPPFLGLLACYDTMRAPLTHRVCVIVFFSLTTLYMFTTLSIYEYLASDAYYTEVRAAGKGRGGPAADALSKLRSSLKMKRAIATIFVVCTVFYLPVGHAMCKVQAVGADYAPEDARLHAARAVCQHLAVICIILYYGTFYYDFGELNLYLVNT